MRDWIRGQQAEDLALIGTSLWESEKVALMASLSDSSFRFIFLI